jgi:integrase
MARNSPAPALSCALDTAQLRAADSARPAAPGQTRKLADSPGLFALVPHKGSIGWRLRWTSKTERNAKGALKDKLLSLGTWPAMSVEKAREVAAAERLKIERGADPAHERQAARVAVNAASAATFGIIGAEVLEIVRQSRAAKTHSVWVGRFNLMRKLHMRPVGEITSGEILAVLTALQRDAGLGETAWRCLNIADHIYRHAIVTDRATYNPALSVNFRGSLKSPEVTNRAHITDPAKLGLLMEWLETPGDMRGDARMSSYPTVRNALRLVAHTWLRSGELRGGLWAELKDLDGSKPEWVVPAGRMKMKKPHVVPLSRQAVAILKEQRAVVEALGGSPLMFPGGRGLKAHPVTANALQFALKTLWADEHSVHGFRHTASTMMNERGFDSAVIELQLSHKGADKIQKVYDKSQRLDARREVMQAYSDLLDDLSGKMPRRTT